MSLLRTTRFLPLFVTQVLSAFNDNMFKNALVVLVIFRGVSHAPELVALSGGLLMLPFALFSSLAGQVADRFEKARLIRLTKWLEVGLMCAAVVGFVEGNVPVLLAVLFGLGVQGAFFSPLKYAILPDHLSPTELVRGNALIEAGAFGGILAGTIAGGALMGLASGTLVISFLGVLVAIAGIASAFLIKPAPPAAPGLHIGWNIFAETARLVGAARANPVVWLCVLGLTWFWTVGAVFLSEFPVLAQARFGADNSVVTLMLACFAIGIGAGSMLAGRLLHGEVSARHVPFAALAITLFAGAFAALVWHVTPQAGWHDISSLAAHPRGVLAMLCLFATAASGGVMSVPLYALIQEQAEPSQRARMVAANNVMNAIGMVVSAGVVAGLAWAGLSAPAIIAIVAVLNLAVAIRIVGLLPRQTLRVVMRTYFKLLHGVTVTGLENYIAAGDHVLIVPNHQSYMDGALIAAFLPDDPSFVVDTGVASKWWARPFLGSVDVLTADPANPFAVRGMVEAVRAGRKLMIFPEGRITRTGGLMKVYDGAGMIADRSGAALMVVRIDGPLRTPFSHMRGKLKQRWFPPLSIAFMPAAKLDVDPELRGRVRRRALGAQMQDLMIAAEQSTRPVDRSLFTALLDAADQHGRKTMILEDATFTPLSFGRMILGCTILGQKLAALSAEADTIGVMLPSANGAMVTLFALQAFGRVPAMLNFTAGADGMLAACNVAGVTTVLTSRVFIEKAKLQAVVEWMEQKIRFVWLEDVRAGIGTRDKLRGLFQSRRVRHLPGAKRDANTPAIVLFTSGSEGVPKGVVLSHRNILSNIAQIGSVIDFNPTDRVLNALPLFHSFGLTGAALLPLFAGVKTFHYPSPLQYRVIPELAYGTDATIAFGTDTFLSGWARYAHPYDMRCMRYIFAGGEKLREETRRTYADRFGVRLLEGYGVTETSPVLALNTPMFSRPGSVGRLLPGMEFRLEPMEGVPEGGRLHVRGPNVMLGYLRTETPGVLEPPPGGWYDTGDIVTCGNDRFITILGRAKRFAKVGGEMVSLAAADRLAAQLWPDALHAVVTVPDARKGEALVLATTQQDATARALLAFARERGIAEIMVPRMVEVIDRMPLLGTGKIDIPAVHRMEKLEKLKSAAVAAQARPMAEAES